MRKVITDLRTKIEEEDPNYFKLKKADDMELKNNREVWVICAILALAGYGLYSFITDIIGWLW